MSIQSHLTTSLSLLIAHTPNSTRSASLIAALQSADAALALAATEGRCDLEARAQLLRGNCFREMGFWGAARGCYERAVECGSSGIEIVDGVVVKR